MDAKKIMVVLPRKGGSRTLGENLIFALNRLNHEVVVFDCGKYKDALSRMVSGDPALIIDLYNQSLVVRALEEKVDAVLIIALSPITPFTVQILKNAGIQTAHYFCEDLRTQDLWKPVIGVYDVFFIIQNDPWLAECRKLNPNTHYVPNGAPVEYVNDGSALKEFNVVFMGVPYPNRVHFFEKLCRLNLDFLIWGWGWDKVVLSPELKRRVMSGTRWLSIEEIYTLYSKARIVLNLHSTLSDAEIEPKGDFVNPRAFSVPLCRSLQVADRREALFEFFTEDKEIVCFNTAQELVAKIQHFLDHPEHAALIIEAAYKRVAESHLITHRVTQMLEIMFPDGGSETLKGRIDRARAKMASGQPATDEDLTLLLAEDVLVRRSSEETE